MPEVKLDAAGAAELAEMLQFLSEWLARDPAHLGASLQEFVSHPAYGITQLRGDLEIAGAAAQGFRSSWTGLAALPGRRGSALP